MAWVYTSKWNGGGKGNRGKHIACLLGIQVIDVTLTRPWKRINEEAIITCTAKHTDRNSRRKVCLGANVSVPKDTLANKTVMKSFREQLLFSKVDNNSAFVAALIFKVRIKDAAKAYFCFHSKYHMYNIGLRKLSSTLYKTVILTLAACLVLPP